MNISDDEKRELVIRLDEKLKAFDVRFESLERSIKELTHHLRLSPCQRNSEKIRTLERFTWGALMASATAVIRSFWAGG